VPAPLIDGTPAADVTLTPALMQTRRPLPGGAAALARADRLLRLSEVAEAAGAAEAALRLTARYLTERRQFGRPLSEFQVLRHRLVGMMIAAQEIEALGLSATAAIAAGAPEADLVLTRALWKAATAGRAVAEEAVQLHGGVGVTLEYRVNAHFRRLTRLSLARGGADALLAALAGGGPA
jgi:alkylation response protein AidB-like acyl-CoA dehydrogenase